MIFRINSVLIVFAFWCCANSNAGANSQSLRADERILQLESWLSPVLEGKLDKKNLIKVWTDKWDQSEDKGSKPVAVLSYAILLEDSGDTFRVFDLKNLQFRTYKKAFDKDEPHRRVGYQSATLNLALANVLENQGGSAFPVFGSIPPVSPAPRVLLAILANQSKRTKEAVFIVQGIPRIKAKEFTVEDIKRIVAKDFCKAWLQFGIQDFANSKLDFKQLRTPFEKILDHFPKNVNAARARATLLLLDKMIKESDARQRLIVERRKGNVARTKEQQIDDLIFELRSQNGQQSIIIVDRFNRVWHSNLYVARCDIFLDERKENSPAQQLVDLGDQALPKLIEALEDDRFTRSVEVDEKVLRISDCCAMIISRIAGKRFDHLQSNTERSEAGPTQDTKNKIKRWWSVYQKKGRKQMLIEGVANGDSESIYQVDRLNDEYPDFVLDALVAGAKKTNLDKVYVEYIQRIGKVKGMRSLVFLKSEFQRRSRRFYRPLLAEQLMLKGVDGMVELIVKDWEQLVPRPNDKGRKFLGSGGFGGGELGGGELGGGVEPAVSGISPERIVEFLVSANDPKAIGAIAKDFDRFVVQDRLEILNTLQDRVHKKRLKTAASQKPDLSKEKAREMDRAIEEFLFQCLLDEERYPNMQMTLSGYSFKNPRICDFAAYTMARCLPEKYKYPRRPTDEEREVVRKFYLEMRKVKRKD